MTLNIRRAAVLGSGVMGAQIAAHLAAAGVRTHLLDLPNDDPPQDPKLAKLVGKRIRSARAIIAIEAMKSLKPSPLMSRSILKHIIPGNFDDDMGVLRECDWIIEAVAERIDIKNAIHGRIAEMARPDVPITTNTSGISVGEMAKAFPEHLVKNFFGTHFFNPPRYLHLVELVPHEDTHKRLMNELGQWISERLGKGIVVANDTTNFIANRIGVFNLQITLKHMQDLDLNIETVDALTGTLMGRPSSATFRTLDVVGLDTYLHTAQNVFDNAPADPHRDVFIASPWLKKLVERGCLGQKTKSRGCYEKGKNDNGKTVILAYRPEQSQYVNQEPTSFSWMAEASKKESLMQRLAWIIEQDDAGAELIWRVLRDTMAYAATCIEEIANGSPKAVDDAIRWGFNWQWGPFEIWQGLGFSKVRERMLQEGVNLPDWCQQQTKFYSPDPASDEWFVSGPAYALDASTGKNRAVEKPAHQMHLPRFQNKADDRVVISNSSLSLLDIGHGIGCLTFHSKMNTINGEILNSLPDILSRVDSEFDGLVVGNDGEHFSAGANLKDVLNLIHEKNWNGIDQMLRQFQGAVQMMKYAPYPVVTAPHGLTLGGGCEVSLHSDAQVLAGDTFAGLVEVGVGLLPAGGGTKELALRAYHHVTHGDNADPMPYLQRAFSLIGMGKVSTSGQDAIEIGLFGHTARACLSKPHLIQQAKQEALHLLQRGYSTPSVADDLMVLGDPGLQTFRMFLYNMVESRFISDYDRFVGERIAFVLCGGDIDPGLPVSESYLLELERQAFVELCQQDKTRERIEHMLKTGKPLRN